MTAALHNFLGLSLRRLIVSSAGVLGIVAEKRGRKRLVPGGWCGPSPGAHVPVAQRTERLATNQEVCAFESRRGYVTENSAEASMHWARTKHGGLRRTGVAQNRKSADQMYQRTETRRLPPVLIKFREKLGLPECPYVIRWRIETPLGSLRLHHWLGPDDDRAFHDHPWWFLTLVLWGGYTDRSPAGDEHLGQGAIRYRPALHQHTVVPDAGGAWTVLITGPKVRSWGFWFKGKFKKANKWFATYGHHPCN